MNGFLPRGFVENERRRIFTPDPFFPSRIISKIAPVGYPPGPLWDLVPSVARPLVAAASLVVLIILGIQIFYPEPPSAGIVDAYLAAEKAPADRWLYDNAELPQGDELILEIGFVENRR